MCLLGTDSLQKGTKLLTKFKRQKTCPYRFSKQEKSPCGENRAKGYIMEDQRN